MAITSVTAPQWGDLEHTFINCVVTTDNTGTEQLPFTASPNDIEPSGQQVFQDCVNGVYGAVAPYTPPPPPCLLHRQRNKTSNLQLVRCKQLIGSQNLMS